MLHELSNAQAAAAAKYFDYRKECLKRVHGLHKRVIAFLGCEPEYVRLQTENGAEVNEENFSINDDRYFHFGIEIQIRPTSHIEFLGRLKGSELWLSTGSFSNRFELPDNAEIIPAWMFNTIKDWYENGLARYFSNPQTKLPEGFEFGKT